ncbi:response regulator transcription factor [Sphingobacteriaceae bacterium WQ 2009]|uniref:Response regulator transcription factor n=1 Tax=Rhinopithecimicrobium faecis TaxID=2820698 RepID=A0A8T4HBP1_9SPHI|nr:response regulator transcription factor [Sphingobacteriaceae bacterium WQ 2009]
MKNIVIIEDHPIVLSNMSLLLNSQQDLHVEKTFMRGVEVRSSSVFDQIDIVFLDINLPDDNGLLLCAFLKEKFPHLKIIGISAFDEWHIIQEFLQAGALGYVVKGADNSHLFRAVEAVMKGERYLCSASNQSKNDYLTASEETILLLTRREKSILKAWDGNSSLAENAKNLAMEEADLKNYIAFLKKKYAIDTIEAIQQLMKNTMH